LLGHLVHKADFERLLGTRSRTRSAHFAIHHVNAGPSVPAKPQKKVLAPELSTELEQLGPQAVDDLPKAVWLGCVVPKRHAKRAVTRNLIKRQIREAFGRHESKLPRGLWMVRLVGMFSPAQFVSARSESLAVAARTEIETLLARVAAAA
jgi:ribonuclease P protein component